MRGVRKKIEPKIVARYGEYAITQGIGNGMYYAFCGSSFLGIRVHFDAAVELIKLREGQAFDINNVEDLRDGR